MPKRPGIDAIVFDMDGLLLDTEPHAYRSWILAAAEFGKGFPHPLFLRILGMNSAGIKPVLRETWGDDFPVDDYMVRASFHYHALLDAEAPDLKPGLCELLDQLDAWAMPRAVATSTRRPSALKKLTRAGILDRLGPVSCGCEVVHGKPAPDLYRLATKRLGLEPHRCLALEDSPNGARAALAAGLVTIVVPDQLQPPDDVRARARAVATSLHDVLAWLRSAEA